jgi:hypothetical protein
MVLTLGSLADVKDIETKLTELGFKVLVVSTQTGHYLVLTGAPNIDIRVLAGIPGV